ncbi:MAG: site-2 protease family protein [Firmicutes bacterium]|nr:site-2 protease family protein [Bacillota bacterium]
MPDLRLLVLRIPGLALGFAFHEFAHAWVYGRLTLEPWVHLDLVGSLLLVFYGYGWAKPVPVNPYNFRRPKRAMLQVALAGPVTNIIVASFFALLLRLWPGRLHVPLLLDVIRAGFWVNIGLAAFNILPIPPLDGAKVLAGVVSDEMASIMEQVERYGPLLLVLLVSTGIVDPLLNAIERLAMTGVVAVVNAVTWFVP